METGTETLAYEADTPGRRALDAPPPRKARRVAKAPPPPAAQDSLNRAMSRALALRRDIDRFQQAWPGLDDAEDPCPIFTWAQLERQICNLAGPATRPIAPGLIRSVRGSAGHKPPEMVLREILCLASSLMDEENPVPGDHGGETP